MFGPFHSRQGLCATLRNLFSHQSQCACTGQLARPDEHQEEWNAFSTFLQRTDLKKLSLPHELDVTGCPDVHAWGAEKSAKVACITIKKRFNSRKLPHMIEMMNDDGDTQQYIFKQDDDITMDVVVVNLFKACNEVWSSDRVKLPIRLKTYKVVACPDKTGFGEIVPGDTMLNFHAKDFDKALGIDKHAWARFTSSVAGVAVATACFDISDRHHNNTLFTPDGEMCLIDLSASLGHKAPLDKGMVINPVYLPNRLLALREYSNILAQTEWNRKMTEFEDFEEIAVRAYYPIYNSPAIKGMLANSGFNMLKPHKFVAYLHARKNDSQTKEKMRNDIVKAMDNSDGFNKFVAGITSIMPIN
ncbi:hypothetical protein SARC_07703 [Sphaeroforma arctica JP610]|uniref:PI3K/PI4K catalytic domain-containing protein n=1 Tax=Sphaeroforma arctica JP610 TaxID=667725 RepID=A0A0L0FVF4_9EUKA|nr:hypothetical protein SARC_07703 [Sphaeroforma arctica JP610]KNC79923.1 hypothetical protein SARC_07703 [Sphaeroforma arctica JP610]|eukprot:XP_014153825.1 hypothetical protein SARC_07703 [Sphaeroforma arctica JP610]